MVACNAITGVGDLEANGIDELDASSKDGSNGTPDGPTVPIESGASSSSGAASSSSGTAVSCATIGGTCSPLAPPGWDGPFLVYDTSVPTAPKACPPQLETTFMRGSGTPTSTFSCPSCRCQGVSGAACTAALTVWTDNTTCAAVGVAPVTVDPSTCYVNPVSGSISAMFKHSVTASGKCDPALNGPPQKGPVSWTTSYLFCGSKNLTAIGCDPTNQVCLPPANGAKTCITKAGADTCPAGWNNSAGISVFGDVNDTRGCDVSGCSCSAPAGVGCGGSLYRSSPNTTCTAPILPPFAVTRAVDTCFVLESGASAKQVNPPHANGGSCSPSGTPKSVGTLAPAAPGITCCLP